MSYEYRIAFARTWLALCTTATERVAAAAVARAVEEQKGLALEDGESEEVGTEGTGVQQDGEANEDGGERQVPTVIHSRDSGLVDSIRKMGIDGKLGSQICAHLEYKITSKKEMQASSILSWEMVPVECALWLSALTSSAWTATEMLATR
jgi:hypothetical protein